MLKSARFRRKVLGPAELIDLIRCRAEGICFLKEEEIAIILLRQG
jgi:hypothetical protein